MTNTAKAIDRWIPLQIPLPPMLERAWFYPYDAEWVSFYFSRGEPGKRMEILWDDGMHEPFPVPFDAWACYLRHPNVGIDLDPYDLWGSNRLLLHRPTRTMYVAPTDEAITRLRRQWDHLPAGGYQRWAVPALNTKLPGWPDPEHDQVINDMADWLSSQSDSSLGATEKQ